MKTLWTKYDTDGTGFIDLDEARVLVKNEITHLIYRSGASKNASEARYDDRDGEGLGGGEGGSASKLEEDELRDIFNQIDIMRSGNIDKAQFS